METNQVNQVIEALKPLADKLGQGAQQFYVLAVRQVYISAFENLIWIALLVYGAVKFYGWAKNEELDEFPRTFSGVGFVVAIVLIGVCICCSISDLANPDYAAISNILDMVVPKPSK